MNEFLGIAIKEGSMYRCTRVENPGEWVPEVFAKIPSTGQGFHEKLPGGSPYFGFYCNFD
jgi:hypothetical protein